MMDRKSKERILTLDIYTDGSLKKGGNNTFGGWGFIVIRDDKIIYSEAGNERDTTNQRMELTAIIHALQYTMENRRENEKVVIYSDSAYIVNCYLEEWYIEWLENNWFNSQHKQVANQDLWEQILPYFDNYWYSFTKVPAHSGNKWNEYCDEIAQAQAQALKKQWWT